MDAIFKKGIVEYNLREESKLLVSVSVLETNLSLTLQRIYINHREDLQANTMC